jgi:hypothetical protein
MFCANPYRTDVLNRTTDKELRADGNIYTHVFFIGKSPFCKLWFCPAGCICRPQVRYVTVIVQPFRIQRTDFLEPGK